MNMNLDSDTLAPLFSPETVAVIGASTTPAAVGYRTVENLLKDGVKAVYPVNPRGGELLGLKIYENIKDVPVKIDLAIIVVSAKASIQAIEDCGVAGVKAAIIGSSGFGETGSEGASLEKQLREAVAKSKVRVLGPNCLGVFNVHNNANLTISASMELVRDQLEPGGVSFVTQSGAYGIALFIQGIDNGLNFCKMVSFGNKMDVEDSAVLEYLGTDPETKVIMAYMEDIKKGRKFFEAAKKITANKPIVAFKVGRTEAGARAAASHTGALAGSYQVYASAFKQAGIIEADTSSSLLEVSRVLSMQPAMKGNRIGLVTNSGGLAAEVSDFLDTAGIQIPTLSPQLQQKLLDEDAVPTWGIYKNPVDMTVANVKYREWYYRSTKILLESDEVDGVLLIMVGVGLEWPADLFFEKAEELKKIGKPIVITGSTRKTNMEKLIPMYQKAGFPVVIDPSIAAKTLAALCQHGKNLQGVKA